MQSVKDQLEPAEIVFGGLTLTADAIEKLGGLEKAGKLVEEGKFEVIYNEKLKTWSLDFHGNNTTVPVEFVRDTKSSYLALARQHTKALKCVKAGGAVFNILGIGITGNTVYTEIKDDGMISAGTGLDVAMTAISFIPIGGWITGGGYFAIKLILDGNEMQGEDLLIRKNFLLENTDEIKPIGIQDKLTP